MSMSIPISNVTNVTFEEPITTDTETVTEIEPIEIEPVMTVEESDQKAEEGQQRFEEKQEKEEAVREEREKVPEWHSKNTKKGQPIKAVPDMLLTLIPEETTQWDKMEMLRWWANQLQALANELIPNKGGRYSQDYV